MTVKVTQSNPSGFSAVAGDPLAAVSEDGSTAFSNFIPTVYEAAAFSIDLEFQGKYADVADPPGPEDGEAAPGGGGGAPAAEGMETKSGT
jgi:hypothetical protein